MIDPDVRVAAPGDEPQLAWLEAEARAALVDQRGGNRWLETHPARADEWATTIATDHVVVAHIGPVLVGYLVLVIAGELAVADDVYVTPEARELGFGDALLASALEHGRAAGCSLFEASSLPGDRNTKNLYERAGITARLITVSTPI